MTKQRTSVFLKKYYFDIVFFLFICGTFFFQRIQPSIILLMFVGLIFYRADQQIIRKRITLRNPAIWFLIYFVLHLTGMIYSEYQMLGWMDVSMKLSLLVFPLFFLFAQQYSVKRFMTAFSIVGALSVIICLLVAFYKYIVLKYNILLSESEFSLFLHRSYQAVYWCLGAIWCFYRSIESSKKLGYFLLGIILSTGTILTFSKAGILALLLSCCVIFLLLIIRYKRYKIAVISIVSAIILLIGINYVTPKPFARFQAMISKVLDNNAEENINDSSNIRILMWRTSVELIKEKPLLGVGTGDIGLALNERNLAKGFGELAKTNLNSHNQFLNSAVALGIPAIIAMLGIFITGFLFGSINGTDNWVVKIIVGSIVLFLVTESAFETQAGVVLFTFLICFVGTAGIDSISR